MSRFRLRVAFAWYRNRSDEMSAKKCNVPFTSPYDERYLDKDKNYNSIKC